MIWRAYDNNSPVRIGLGFGEREWRNLADAPDLGSGGVTHGGSSPPSRTRLQDVPVGHASLGLVANRWARTAAEDDVLKYWLLRS